MNFEESVFFAMAIVMVFLSLFIKKTKTKKTPKGHGSTLEEMRLDHAISSAITAMELSLCCIILKRRR